MKLILLLKKLFCTESLFYVGGSDDLPPPLSREEEAKAIAELIAGSEEARRLLNLLRIVVHLIEDLTGIGAVGLIKAVNTFNSDKNIKLATYASRCIENEILMFLRKAANRRAEISISEPLNTD